MPLPIALRFAFPPEQPQRNETYYADGKYIAADICFSFGEQQIRR